jgi:hypothetical protein
VLHLTSITNFDGVSYHDLIYFYASSLGGALATLFTFYASTSKFWGDLSPFSVTCVSVASPLVGDYNWCRAFMLQGKVVVIDQHLVKYSFLYTLFHKASSFSLYNAWTYIEKLGKIRHLRISNYGDVVPKVPCFGLDIPPFPYQHVGIQLQLYDNVLLGDRISENAKIFNCFVFIFRGISTIFFALCYLCTCLEKMSRIRHYKSWIFQKKILFVVSIEVFLFNYLINDIQKTIPSF